MTVSVGKIIRKPCRYRFGRLALVIGRAYGRLVAGVGQETELEQHRGTAVLPAHSIEESLAKNNVLKSNGIAYGDYHVLAHYLVSHSLSAVTMASLALASVWADDLPGGFSFSAEAACPPPLPAEAAPVLGRSRDGQRIHVEKC